MALLKFYFPKTSLFAELSGDGRWKISGGNSEIAGLFLSLLEAFGEPPPAGRLSREWLVRTAQRVAHRFGGEIVADPGVRAGSVAKLRRLPM
jgi:hypothetical protein